MHSERNEPNRPKALNALTSLRFFAAVVIVVHHTKGSFGLTEKWLIDLPTSQAVSFFFVLSGFILTYVYQSFDQPGTIRKFLTARVGRIWPLHIATLALVFLLFPADFRTPGGKDAPSILLANIFLIQGWIPIWNYYFSYNWLSWAVSAEVSFYLLFPFLRRRWEASWHIKLFLTLLLAFGTIFCVKLFQIPPGNAVKTTGNVGYLGLVYISPIARLFEFVIGMTVALAYRRSLSFRPWKKPAGTLFESLALAMTIGIFSFTPEIVAIIHIHFPWVTKAGGHWLTQGGLSCVFFAFLILAMAMERGAFSRGILSRRFLTKLGDLSLAIFLLHQILFRYYEWRFAKDLNIPEWFAYGYYWAILLAGSYILMEFIEKPCRKIINKLGQPSKSPKNRQVIDAYHPYRFKSRIVSSLKKNWNGLFILLLFSVLLLPIFAYLHQGPRRPENATEQTEAKSIKNNTATEYRNISFGKKFMLTGAVLNDQPDSILLKLVWKSLDKQRLRYVVAVHILNEKGDILSQVDYRQSPGSIPVKNGAVWIEKTTLEKENLRYATDLGIVIYSPDPVTPFFIDSGRRDWKGHRLLIALPKQDKR